MMDSTTIQLPPASITDPGRSYATALAKLASRVDVFLDEEGEQVYATVEVGDHSETWSVQSRGFKRWLTRSFFVEHHRAAGQQAITDALLLIEAQAQVVDLRRPVALRTAEHDGRFYLDLGDPRWQVVEIFPGTGWSLVSRPPIRFRRARGMLPLPLPRSGGSLAALRGFVNVESDNDWTLLVAWLLAALRPTGPYPVLVLHGEHGSAKSTLARVLRALIDPNHAPIRAEPRDPRDLAVAASNAWIIALDNLSRVSPWLSDALCRLSTGGGFSTRVLYTDAEEMIFTAQRPVILTGIEDTVTRADLSDRVVRLTLPAIPDNRRRAEKDYWCEFQAAAPGILGALLDALAGALARVGSVQLPGLPRMADFARFATAAEPGLGWRSGQFMKAYTGNRQDTDEVTLESSPIGSALRELLLHDKWAGTATDLVKDLTERGPDRHPRSREWPETARKMRAELTRIAPVLRALGVPVALPSAHEGRESGTGRRIIKLGQWPAEPSRPSQEPSSVKLQGLMPDGSVTMGQHPDNAPPRGNPAGCAAGDGRDGRDGSGPTSPFNDWDEI
jgi:hypothetical protein